MLLTLRHTPHVAFKKESRTKLSATRPTASQYNNFLRPAPPFKKRRVKLIEKGLPGNKKTRPTSRQLKIKTDYFTTKKRFVP